MSVSEKKLHEKLAEVFIDAIKKANADDAYSLSDMYVCVKYDDLSLLIYDDTEQLLLSTTIDEWDELKETCDNFEETVIDTLKAVLGSKLMREELESLEFVGPFSVILIDEDFEQICELVTVDHDNIVLEDNFFEKIDKELDDFFEQLMSDVK